MNTFPKFFRLLIIIVFFEWKAGKLGSDISSHTSDIDFKSM